MLRRLWREDGLTPGQIARQLGLATQERAELIRALRRMHENLSGG